MFKYVPVLRYRQEELRALLSVRLTHKTIPLIEIVKEKPMVTMKDDFVTIHTTQLNKLDVPLMVDFPMYLPFGQKTNAEVVRFLQPIQRNQRTRIQRFQQLSGINNLIPVVSYNPRTALNPGYLVTEAAALREYFPRLAFRIFVPGFQTAINEITNILREHDVLILDLDEAPHTNPGLNPLYQAMVGIGHQTKCPTVLIRSAIPNAQKNTTLVDNQVLVTADNSLLALFAGYGFSAFGDYAGIKKDLLTNGGSISPGFIFYSWRGNSYIGYRGRVRVLSEFETHIVPTVMRSPYWTNYRGIHNQNCPGCQQIMKISSGNESGKSQAKWKGITVSHYLHTMEESL